MEAGVTFAKNILTLESAAEVIQRDAAAGRLPDLHQLPLGYSDCLNN